MKPKHQATVIKKLRKKIPDFKCKPSCHECCGWIPLVFWERKQMESSTGERKISKNLLCPYVENGGCSAHKEKPILCRIYGASEEKKMLCPYGCKPDKPLSIEETRAIMKEYIDLKPRLLSGDDEVKEAIKGKQVTPKIYKEYGKT